VTSSCISVLQQYVKLFGVASGTVTRYVYAARHRGGAENAGVENAGAITYGKPSEEKTKIQQKLTISLNIKEVYLRKIRI